MGFGKRATSWKWWWEHETREGKVVMPKKTNQRDLRRKRSSPRDRKIPLHLAENNPPPASKEAVPINRRGARARASEGSPKDD
ncbi:MAG: hypothetical protein CL879_03480 [Dehalococcoidia bacterium]|nr:hypothetical protein [Dehalococcoidia bacterium]